ncbi:MAG: glycosyltransferase family 39 protein [Planctomycetota bacterium]
MRILSPVSLLAMLSRRLPWFLFCLALGVRLGYWHDISLDPSNGYPLYHAVRGVPYSDAQSYDLSAAEVAAGGEVPEYWRARRPIYSYLLAALYTWTGPSFNVAILLNIVLGAVTVVLIFQIFARIFSVAVGLPVGIWAAFDPEQISGSMVIMTEPLGFFFLCWHFWLMVRAPSPSKTDLFVSGVLFAISNLTRTLTLFAFPFYFLGMVIQGLRRRWGIWRSGMFATVFFAGLFATLFPFMFAQWLRYGIFTLQDTTASHFYAATSPDYKAWDASIEQMADDMNLKDTKERYQFFMSKARKNLFKYPRTFVSKLIENSKIPFFKSISFVNSQPFRAEFFALSLLAILLAAPRSVRFAAWVLEAASFESDFRGCYLADRAGCF